MRDRLKYPRSHEKPVNIQRDVVLLPARFNMSSKIEDDGSVRVYRPFPMKAARAGSHGRKDLISILIAEKTLLQKPAKALFLESSSAPEGNISSESFLRKKVGLALLLINIVSIFLLKKYLFEDRLALNVHSRLFLGIFTAAVIPLAVFAVVASVFLKIYQNIQVSNTEKFLKQEINLLELNLMNNEMIQQRKLKDFKNEVNLIRNSSSTHLQKKLDSQTGKIHDGYIFVRSDGLILEKFNSLPDFSKKDKDKFKLITRLYKGTVIRVFRKMKIFKGKLARQFSNSPEGKGIIAVGDLFMDMDIDNFCLQDGDYFQTDKENKTHLRMISYTLYPDKSEPDESRWAFVVFLQDGRRLSEEYLNGQLSNWEFFKRKVAGVATELSIFSLSQDSEQAARLNHSWPGNFVNRADFVSVAKANLDGKGMGVVKKISDRGFQVIFAVRRLFKLPFIIVGRSEMTGGIFDSGIFQLFLIALLAYSILLVAILASCLTQVFLKPVKAMLTATSQINNGHFPQIVYRGRTELYRLINRFNQMTKGLRERKDLERFVSKDATEAVVDESLLLTERSNDKLFSAILFCHIRDFTRVCEKLEAEEIIKLLNLYFSVMEPVIVRNGGMIDKYIGDAIMVAFSRKNENEVKTCKQACSCAIEMHAALNPLNVELKIQGLPEIKGGYGIACGEVIRGKIGAKEGRKDLTLIGDSVNIAARLENASHSRPYSAIMVSDAVAEKVSGIISLKPCGKISLKGKSQKQEIFEVRGA